MKKRKNLQWMKDEVQIIFQDPYSALNPFWNVRELSMNLLKKPEWKRKRQKKELSIY